MKMTKDGVIKTIPENLIGIYLNLGWKEYKIVKVQPKINVEKKD